MKTKDRLVSFLNARLSPLKWFKNRGAVFVGCDWRLGHETEWSNENYWLGLVCLKLDRKEFWRVGNDKEKSVFDHRRNEVIEQICLCITHVEKVDKVSDELAKNIERTISAYNEFRIIFKHCCAKILELNWRGNFETPLLWKRDDETRQITDKGELLTLLNETLRIAVEDFDGWENPYAVRIGGIVD